MRDVTEVVADRLVSGEDGGRYTRDNIAPHCPLCSSRQGQRRTMRILIWRYHRGLLADYVAGVWFQLVDKHGREIVTRLPDPALL